MLPRSKLFSMRDINKNHHYENKVHTTKMLNQLENESAVHFLNYCCFSMHKACVSIQIHRIGKINIAQSIEKFQNSNSKHC